jgi:hypothetical protein
MSFEEMIGTTGVSSDGNTLYVSNNNVITRIDRVNNKTDIPHTFEFVEYLYLGPLYLCGIYAKDLAKEMYGIFLMELATHKFTNLDVGYYPYMIKSKYQIMGNLAIFVMDRYYNCYIYNESLNLDLAIESGPPDPYRTVDYVITDSVDILSTNNQLYLTPVDPELDKVITDDIITTLYQNNKLYILYKSGYNEYSIIGYDLEERKILKTLFGGHSATRVYACIHLNSIYVSAETNKIFPLTTFAPPSQVINYPKPTFNIFETAPMQVEFIDAALNLNTTLLKEKKDSVLVDTRPVIKNHIYYYVWFAVCILLLALMMFTFLSKEKRLLNIMILLILSIAVFFILRRYI